MTKTNYTVKNITRVAIYIRVSTKEQAMEGYSVGEQTERLKKFAEAHGWIIVRIYTDAGHSGADTDRPALQEMLEDVRAGKIDKVLVYKLDRLSRSQKDTLALIEDEFLTHNTDFESMTEKLDTSTAHGRAMIGILAAFAQLEREMITERMAMGMEARLKEGKWRGSNVPFGYDYDPALDKLIIDPYSSMIIKDIFQMFTTGTSIYKIIDIFTTKGYKFKNGKFDNRNVKYCLQNKTYCGYLRFQGDWIKGLHDAIIDEETYDKAQKILNANRQKYIESGRKVGIVNQPNTYLGGFLWCKRCGARYTRYRTGNKAYGFHENYACYSRCKKLKHMIKDPTCKNNNYRMHELDEIIFNEVRKLALDPNRIHEMKHQNTDAIDAKNRIQLIESHTKQLEAQISRFMDLYGIGKFTIEELEKKIDPLRDEKKKLQNTLLELQNDNLSLPEERAIELVKSFDEVLKKGNLQAVRAVLDELISRIEIDGEDIYIHWKFE